LDKRDFNVTTPVVSSDYSHVVTQRNGATASGSGSGDGGGRADGGVNLSDHC